MSIKIPAADVIKVRLAPASERYHRCARKGDALGFAAALAEVVPGCGAKVYRGSPLHGRNRAFGFVVTFGDDVAAALAAGVGRCIGHIKGSTQ